MGRVKCQLTVDWEIDEEQPEMRITGTRVRLQRGDVVYTFEVAEVPEISLMIPPLMQVLTPASFRLSLDTDLVGTLTAEHLPAVVAVVSSDDAG